MSKEFTSSDVPSANPPESFPAVSVDLSLGKKLQQAGRGIEVDLNHLNQGLEITGVPDDKLEKVDYHIRRKSGWSQVLGHTAPVTKKGEEPRYKVDIYVEDNDIREDPDDRIQGTILHEDKHVSTFMEITEREGGADAIDSLYVEPKMGMYGRFVAGLSAAAAYGDALHLPEQFDLEPSHLFGEAAALAAGAVASFVAGRILYAVDEGERSARNADAEFSSQVSPIVTFPKIEESTGADVNTEIVQSEEKPESE